MLTVAEEAHKTDTGRQRHANEDSYFARSPLFAVADGMGGAQAGEVASRIAASAFERRQRLSREEPAEGQLEEIAQTANREIHQLAQEDSSRAGMGTTLTAAMVRNDEVAFGHVGDSRAYVLRDGKLKRLTKDHSLVEELRRQGRLTEEQAEEHPQRSIITRALGPEPSVNVDTMTFPARDGDVFLLCSDGLTTMVSDDEIRRILTESRSLRGAVNRLVEAANRGGGRDNITAVAFRLADAEAKEGEESATLISRTAEQAGLTGERMRAAGDRLRGQGPMPAPPRRRRILGWVVAALAAIVVFGGGFLVARSIYFLGTDNQGDVAALPRPALPAAARDQPLLEAVLDPGPGGHPLRGAPEGGHRPHAAGQGRRDGPRRRHQAEADRGAAATATAAGAREEEEVWGQLQGPAGKEDLSARTRELFALIPVALLVTAGFTAVLITNSDQLGNLSVLYGAYFLAVCVATHIVIRIRLPDADPFLFPLVALLAAFGLVMLYRLDEGLARDQANWFVLGLVLFSATIIFLRDYEALERYRYLIALAGIVLLILPRFLGHATNDAYLGDQPRARSPSSRPSWPRSASSSSSPAT